MQETLRVFDPDERGYVGVAEVRLALEPRLQASAPSASRMSQEDVDQLIATLDPDGDGRIEYGG